MPWVLIRSASPIALLMSILIIYFLWRTGENYPRIIIKYSSKYPFKSSDRTYSIFRGRHTIYWSKADDISIYMYFFFQKIKFQLILFLKDNQQEMPLSPVFLSKIRKKLEFVFLQKHKRRPPFWCQFVLYIQQTFIFTNEIPREIIQKVWMQELWFLHFAWSLMLTDIHIKFREDTCILNSFQIIERIHFLWWIKFQGK